MRILDVSQTGETIPYPPFYDRVRAGGSRVVPDAAHMTAMPFIDVAVFNREPTLRTVFHNLVQVAQFSALGPTRVMEGYFHVLKTRPEAIVRGDGRAEARTYIFVGARGLAWRRV